MKFGNIKTALLIVSAVFSTANARFFPPPKVSYFKKPKVSPFNKAVVNNAVAEQPLNITKLSLETLEREYPNLEFKVGNALRDENANTAYVHVSQAIDGYEIINSSGNINIDIPTKSIISTSFAVWDNVERFDPTQFGLENLNLDVEDALAKVAEYFHYDYDKDETEFVEKNGIYIIDGVRFTIDKKARGEKKYITISEKYADCVWELSLEVGDIWYLARVSATTGGLLNVENLQSHAVYNAVPWNKADITSGRVIYEDPADLYASPYGWHGITQDYTTYETSGNNIIVQENHAASPTDSDTTRAFGGESLNFNFPVDLTAETVEESFDAAATNVFVLTNILHDVYYEFGFNEKFGNFQVNNFNRGGAGEDPVKVIIQDRTGTNNANFATPVDGYSPKMRLFPFTAKDPERDSSFVNQIIIHEYSHGVTQRLTGGPDKTSCLSEDEPNALSEGWSDFFAIAMEVSAESKPEDEIYMFEWLYGTFARSKPISTDMSINDLTFSSLTYELGGQLECHKGGEVWVNTLNEMLWNFIELRGISENVFESVKTKDITFNSEGNIIAIQIVIDALKIQPCNPTFIQARDAILLAQEQRYDDPEFKCAIWKAFAKRGMGYYATEKVETYNEYLYTDNFDLPEECMDM